MHEGRIKLYHLSGRNASIMIGSHSNVNIRLLIFYEIKKKSVLFLSESI